MTDASHLYPDLARGRRGAHPPSAYEDEARRWIAADTHRWTPAHHSRASGAETLAVIGAMVLSAAARSPLGWDGESLRGPVDPVRLLLRAAWGERKVKRVMRVMIAIDGAHGMTMPPMAACKYWAGHVTAEAIWARNLTVLRAIVAMADDCARRAGPDAPPPWLATMDIQADADMLGALASHAPEADLPDCAATGYDATVVSLPSRDGLTARLHPDIQIVGHRPAVEVYAMIGAAWVEAAGRWPTPHQPQIPAIDGVVLRDRLDLDRLMLVGKSGPWRGEMASQWRSYLTPL